MATLLWPLWLGNNYNNNLNANNNVNNNSSFFGIAWALSRLMKTYNNLWENLCSFENIELAFKKARKRKTKKAYVAKFEKNLNENLLKLRNELISLTYKPRSLKTFILRDPKTRKISKSHFRDRIVHHTLCNIIEPIFDKTFIYDSYANRKSKGALKAIYRFDNFKIRATNNLKSNCYVFKADIKHYFDAVDHKILLDIIKRKIKDEKVIWLIQLILSNFNIKVKDKGMPLGNLTSQFFANIYLNELDQFVKHELKAKYYIRYVDDFIILNREKRLLEYYKDKISNFLKQGLLLELHPGKCKIILLKRGVNFLGFREFYYHKLLRKSNIRKMRNKLKECKQLYSSNKVSYDKIYNSLQSWLAYARYANTYKLRKSFANRLTDLFPSEVSSVEVNRYLKLLS